MLSEIRFGRDAGVHDGLHLLLGQDEELLPGLSQIKAGLLGRVHAVHAEASALLRRDQRPFDGIWGQVLGQVPDRQHIGDQACLDVVQVIVGSEV